MHYFLLLTLLSINVWGMKRNDDNYIDRKQEIVKEQQEDIITFETLDYVNSIMVKTGDHYTSYLVSFLYKWLILDKNPKIPGIEIVATPQQRDMITLYYQALPLAENMTIDQINEITSWLFKLYLDGDSEDIAATLCDLIYNKSVYELIVKKKFINDRGKLTDDGKIFLKRFLRKENITTMHFPFFDDNASTIEDKINTEPSKYNNGWTIRKSFSAQDDPKNLTYNMVFNYVANNKIYHYQINYESGLGFYYPFSRDEKKYFTNFIDILESYFSIFKLSKNNYFRGVKKETPITYAPLNYNDSYSYILQSAAKEKGINYGNLIMMPYKNSFVPCSLSSLYPLLGNNNKVFGYLTKNSDDSLYEFTPDEKASSDDKDKEEYKPEDEVVTFTLTDEQKNMIKYYYETMNLAEGMSVEEINDLIPELFERYLKGNIGTKQLDLLKRFLFQDNLPKDLFPCFDCNLAEVNAKIDPKTVKGGWSLRRSFTYKDDNKNLSYCIVFFYVKNEKIIHIRIHYKSGTGFYAQHETGEYSYYTNLIDMLNHLRNSEPVKDKLITM